MSRQLLLDIAWWLLSFVHLPDHAPILPPFWQAIIEWVVSVYFFVIAVLGFVGVFRRVYRDIDQMKCFLYQAPNIPPILPPYDQSGLERVLVFQIVLSIIGVLPWKLLRNCTIYFLLRGYDSVYSRSHVQAKTLMLHYTEPHKAQVAYDIYVAIMMFLAAALSAVPSPVGLLCLIVQLSTIEMIACQVAIHTHGFFPHADDLDIGQLLRFGMSCLMVIDSCRTLVPGSQWLATVFCVWQVADIWLYRQRVRIWEEFLIFIDEINIQAD